MGFHFTEEHQMRNDNCTTCGGFGYTIDSDECMTGCHECFVAAHEADHAEAVKANHCSEDDRGHEFGFAAHRCMNCNQVHPSLREAV